MKSITCAVNVTETRRVDTGMQYRGPMSGPDRPQLERHRVTRTLNIGEIPDFLPDTLIQEFAQIVILRNGGIPLDTDGKILLRRLVWIAGRNGIPCPWAAI